MKVGGSKLFVISVVFSIPQYQFKMVFFLAVWVVVRGMFIFGSLFSLRAWSLGILALLGRLISLPHLG